MFNLFLIIVAAVSLVFIWLLWLRNYISSALIIVQHQSDVLQSDLDKRKDMVPYLLQSFLKSETKSDMWNRLVAERSEFHKTQPIEKEWEFEKSIWSFLKASEHVKNVTFLEAKKDIEDHTDIIEKEKQNLEQAITEYNERRKTFPYSMVSGIFGFHELT